MAFRIITADERLSAAENKTSLAIFGPPGVGKTTLLKTLPAEETVCLDLEAGMKSVQDWRGDSIPVRSFTDWSASYGTTWDDSSQGADLYDGFIAAAVAEAITEDAAWYCWHASRRQAMLEACWEKAGAFVHQQIIWVKDRGVLTRSHYLWKHEPCFMGWRRPNRPPKVAEETLPSTWETPSFAKDERHDHPTPKPLDAFGIPMRQHVPRGGLCYEPFSGSGSQIMAGEANGRRVFAMEISPAYVDVAVERWQAETGRDAILDGDGRTFAEVKAEQRCRC